MDDNRFPERVYLMPTATGHALIGNATRLSSESTEYIRADTVFNLVAGSAPSCPDASVDLLAALKTAERFIASELETSKNSLVGEDEPGTYVGEAATALAAVRAAIAKAEGGGHK